MWTLYRNITQLLLIQDAVVSILDNIGHRSDSRAACVIAHNAVEQRAQTEIDFPRITELPTVVSDCRLKDGEFESFLKQMQQGVTMGCAFFVVSRECAPPFLDNFQEIHDWVEQKYVKKVLVLIDTEDTLTVDEVIDLLKHRTVINELPLAQLLKPSINNELVEIWSAFPYSSTSQMYNRFFLSNFSFEYDKEIIPKLTDLGGLPVVGAFIHYPPYTAVFDVPAGTGNAKRFDSNESLDLWLDGQEHILLIEFCLKYNCTLIGRMEYDDDLWGESFPNHTGTGLTGALTTREANVSCAALYLWDNTYYFTQYTAILQRATITHIVPKPFPLPYWQTPILPFPGYIWGYVIGSFLIGAVVLFTVNFTQNLIEQGTGVYGLFDSVYAVFMMSIFQGVNINIKFFSNIAIFTVILIYALVIGNLYAGGLASVMTITRYEEPVDTIEKLVDSKFMWGSTALSCSDELQDIYATTVGLSTTQKIRRQIYGAKHPGSVKISAASPNGSDAGNDAVWYVDLSGIHRQTVIKVLHANEATSVLAGYNYYGQQNLAIHGTAQSDRFYGTGKRNKLILGAGCYRLMNYDIQRNIEENSKPPDGGEPVRLSIEHILGVLLLWIVGNTVAVIFFILEMVWHHNRKRTTTLFRKFLARYHCTRVIEKIWEAKEKLSE